MFSFPDCSKSSSVSLSAALLVSTVMVWSTSTLPPYCSSKRTRMVYVIRAPDSKRGSLCVTQMHLSEYSTLSRCCTAPVSSQTISVLQYSRFESLTLSLYSSVILHKSDLHILNCLGITLFFVFLVVDLICHLTYSLAPTTMRELK